MTSQLFLSQKVNLIFQNYLYRCESCSSTELKYLTEVANPLAWPLLLFSLYHITAGLQQREPSTSLSQQRKCLLSGKDMLKFLLPQSEGWTRDLQSSSADDNL